ncbi:hypothetical protein TI03_03350 [Achromatium sp. WMS1]|nr:hypothetical protein TI03_03350 [Achromatium sp. WMS1]
MFQSELLKEKYRVQAILSRENPSAHEYLVNSHRVTQEIAKAQGFHLNYVTVSNLKAVDAKITNN